jgi:hypothetical protein
LGGGGGEGAAKVAGEATEREQHFGGGFGIEWTANYYQRGFWVGSGEGVRWMDALLCLDEMRWMGQADWRREELR